MLRIQKKIEKRQTGFKGIGNILPGTNNLGESWNILKDNVSLPAATLSQSTLRHNQSWMNKFAEKFNFHFAPHGKTTMLPDLFSLQLSSGAWGITLANASQIASAYKSGVKRIILANQLVGQCNMDIISTILSDDPNFEFICLVDSPENISQLGEFFKTRNQKINVFLEYGPMGAMGGRTGIRNDSQEEAVINELSKWPTTVIPLGIEFFEGILKDEQIIRQFIQRCLSRIKVLVEKRVFPKEEIIISGAGTSWLDVVAEEFQSFEKSSERSFTKILRSGCYLIYDFGMYEPMEKRVLNMNLGQTKDYSILSESLKPALKIWTYVQSIPESNLAIVGMGKRDIAVDCGFPVPHSLHRYVEGQSRKTMCCPKGDNSWKIFNMMDQHTFMRISENDDIRVGDVISFDIYHPCTTMDKWKNFLLIDDLYNVIDIYHSEF